MAVIDDEALGLLFRRAADEFEIPDNGPDDILRRAMGFEAVALDDQDDDGNESPLEPPVTTLRRLPRALRQHKLLTVAAAVIAIGAIGTSAALLSGSSTPTRPVTSASAPPHLPVSSTTTTAPSTGDGVASPELGAPISGGTGATAPQKSANQGFSALAPSVAPSAGGTASPATSGATATPGSLAQPTRIEQTGTLSLQVPRHSLTTTMTKLTFLAAANGGFVANSQTQGGKGGSASGSVTLQVPVASFSALLKSAQALGTTVSVSTKAADVTSQYVDLQAQITALQASQQQYLLIMTKATTIGDILSVQSQLSSLETQIQQLQGQEQLLNSQTTYSTLSVSVTEASRAHHHVTPHHRSGLSRAWHASLHGFAAGLDGLVRIAGPVLFALLCAAALLVLGRLSWRRYQRHRL